MTRFLFLWHSLTMNYHPIYFFIIQMHKPSIYVKNLLLTAIAFLMSACPSSGDKIDSKFNIEPEVPEIQEMKVTEVLKPIDITFNNDYLCVLHEEKAKGDQIYVFDPENLHFLYSFAKRGSAPDETLALDFMKNLRGDSIDLIDQANYKKLTYRLTPDSAVLVESKYLELPPLGPTQEAYWVNDSIMIFNTLDGSLLTYDDRSNRIIDQLNLTDFISDLPEDANKSVASFNFSIDGKEIFVGMRAFNELLKLGLDDDYRFTKDNTLSLSAHQINVDKITDNYNYFAFISGGKDNVVAQYYGRKAKDLQPFPININGSNLKFDLIVLDDDLNPLHLYQTDSNILRAVMDEGRKRIYLLEAFEDFDALKYIEYDK